MRNLLLMLLASVSLLSFSNVVLAATLDAATIKSIHDEIKPSFLAKCKKDMVGATDALCLCLGEKIASSLDDTALGLCASDDSGGPCITNAVAAATTMGMTKENIDQCKVSSVSTNTNVTKTEATTTTTNSDAVDGTVSSTTVKSTKTDTEAKPDTAAASGSAD